MQGRQCLCLVGRSTVLCTMHVQEKHTLMQPHTLLHTQTAVHTSKGRSTKILSSLVSDRVCHSDGNQKENEPQHLTGFASGPPPCY
jgi:hypothetical protein